MANTVNLSSSIRTNLLALQNTNSLFKRTSERLSTGLRINSALDGASPFFAARNLNNRASDFTNLKDGIGQAIQTLKTADKGLEAMTKLVEQAKSLADQAKEASLQTSLKSGTAGTTDATGSTVLTTAFTGITALDSFTIAVDAGAAVAIVVTAGDTIDTFITKVENVDSGLSVTYNTATDKLELTAPAGTEVVIDDETNTPGATLFGTVDVTTVTFGSTGSGATVPSLELDFEKVMAEINQLVADTSYKGVNLLNGNNLTVNVNESSATLTITGSTLNVTGLGFASGAAVNFATAGQIDTSITESKAALTKLRDTASSFSTDLALLQARDSFTSDLISSLESGAGLLVDANLEKESANLLALQTRQALGTSALSFASQAQQSVLQLFR